MKFLIGLLFCVSAHAGMNDYPDREINLITLLSGATATGAGSYYQLNPNNKTFQACGTTSAGSGASVVAIQVSDKALPASTDWITAGSITLTLASTNACDGFVSDARWRWWRANVISISGTTATVAAYAGY